MENHTHFLKLLDFTPAEIRRFLDTAADLKAKKKAGISHRYLEGRNINAGLTQREKRGADL